MEGLIRQVVKILKEKGGDKECQEKLITKTQEQELYMIESAMIVGNYIVVADAGNVEEEMVTRDCLPIMEKRDYSVPSIIIMMFMAIERRCVGSITELQGTTRPGFCGRQVTGILNQKHFNKKEMKDGIQ